MAWGGGWESLLLAANPEPPIEATLIPTHPATCTLLPSVRQPAGLPTPQQKPALGPPTKATLAPHPPRHSLPSPTTEAGSAGGGTNRGHRRCAAAPADQRAAVCGGHSGLQVPLIYQGVLVRVNQTESKMYRGAVDALRQSSNTVCLPYVARPLPCPPALQAANGGAERRSAGAAEQHGPGGGCARFPFRLFVG